MRYKLEDILTFLTVIEAGGLTAAARRLGVAKSVASKRISDLESSLGATLLRRSARGVVPTEAGAAFNGRARDILEHFSIRLGVSRVCEISFAFSFGNPF